MHFIGREKKLDSSIVSFDFCIGKLPFPLRPLSCTRALSLSSLSFLTMAAASAAVQAAVLGAAQAVEAAVDAKIDALDAALRDGDNAANSDDLAALRARRLAQLRADADARAQWERQGHGVLHHARSDKECFDAARGCARVVACFARASSRPCDAMERLLSQLAPRHLEAKFVRVDAERCPFLADKMRVTVLPTLAVLLEGRAEGYQVGFDGLPGGDGCGAAALEARLVDLGGLRPEGVSVLSSSSSSKASCGSAPSMEKHRSGMVRGGRRGEGRVAEEDEDSDFD